MSRPIPVDIIPSHVYLSAADQDALFGAGRPLTVLAEHTQTGQVVYGEQVEVFGRLKRSLFVHVLGPNWVNSHVEVSPTEAAYLGYQPDEVKTGDLSAAVSCRLHGPHGSIELSAGLICPQPHLTCSPAEAEQLKLKNGQIVSMNVLTATIHRLDNVIVRVHPTFRLRLELHADYARQYWIAKPTYANLIS